MKLTDKQREVLRLLANGHTWVSAAETLGLTVNGIYERYRSAARANNARTTTQLVAKAFAAGELTKEDVQDDQPA